MFGTILIAVCTSMHVYVVWRAAVSPPIKGRIGRVWILAVALSLWLVFVLGRVYGHHGTGALAFLLEFSGMTWMGTLLLTTAALLAVDVCTGFGFLFPRIAPAARSAALFSGLAVSAIALILGNAPPVPERHEIRLKGLPAALDDTRLVAVSDLHLNSRNSDHRVDRLVEAVRSEHPDMVVFIGDMFEGHGEIGGDVAKALGKIRAPLGKWAVLGNHEAHGDPENCKRILKMAGFQVLSDEWKQAAPGLVVAGVDDIRDGRNKEKNLSRIARSMEKRPPGATVFLSHRPVYAETAAKHGAGLMLSGHTHAGQIWPFGYLVKRRYSLFSGRYNVDGMDVVVSRGAGTWGPGMRFPRRGDILSISLRSKAP